MKNERKLLRLPLTPMDTPEVTELPMNYCLWAARYENKAINLNAIMRTVETDPKALEITVYNEDNDFLFKHFLSKEGDSITLRQNNKRSEAKLDTLINHAGYWIRNNRFSYSHESLKNTEEFLKHCEIYKPSKQIIQELINYEEKCAKKRIDDKNNAIRKSIDNIVMTMPELPKNLHKWLINGPLKSNRYLVYQYTGRKIEKAYCTHCKSDVEVVRPKHLKHGKCPNCKSLAEYRAAGKTTKGIYILTRACVIQKTKDKKRIVLRHLHVTFNLTNIRKPGLYCEEVFLEFVDPLEPDKIQHRYEWGNFRQTEDYYWNETYTNSGPYFLEWVYGAALHNYKFKKNTHNYFPYEKLFKTEQIIASELFKSVEENPGIEYLVKFGFTKLAAEAIGHDTSLKLKEKKSMAEIFGVYKEHLPLLSLLNVDDLELTVFKLFFKNNLGTAKEIVDFILWNRKNEAITNYYDIDKWSAFGKVSKAVQYIESQRKHQWFGQLDNRLYTYRKPLLNKELTKLWFDYLAMCEQLEISTESKQIRYPEDCKAAHDQFVEEVNKQKEIIEQKRIKRESLKISRKYKEENDIYFFETDDFFITLPKNANEINEEGNALSHCVRTYVSRVACGQTTVLFIRKKTNPDKPYFTLEYKENKIVQIRGKGNCSPGDDVRAFVKSWEKYISSDNNYKNRPVRIAI